MWSYKLRFTTNSELFEYDLFGTQGAGATQAEFPYQESFLSFLEMDSSEWDVSLAEITSDWERCFSAGSTADADRAMQKMGTLAGRHIYFRPPYLRWFSRKAASTLPPEMTEELRQLPEQLAAYQK